jgi:hypothetical protein
LDQAPISAANVDPHPAAAVVIRASFLVLCHGGVVLSIGVRLCRAAIVAHRRSVACLALVTACRLLLLGGAIVMPDCVVVAIRNDHLGHTGRRRQEYRRGESRA